MAVYDQSYKPWSGALHARPRRILAIIAAGLRQPFQNFLIKLVVILFYFLMGVWLFLLYIIVSAPHPPPFFLGNTIYRTAFFNFPGFPILIGIFAAAVGSPLISRDLQHNALIFYFSKSIKRGDYLLAKYLTIVLLLLSITWGPVLMLFVGQLFMGVEELTTAEKLKDLWAITAHSFIVVIPMAAAILALSAVSKRPYLGGILWAIIYFASWAAGEVLQKSIRREWCALVSWQNVCAHLAEFVYHDRKARLLMFGMDTEAARGASSIGWLPPLLILLAITAISLALTRWRIRSAEAGE